LVKKEFSLSLLTEFGGYYDAVFLTPDFVSKSRPYAEVGATYALP